VIYAIFTAVGVVALVLAVATIVSVLRNPRLSGGERAVWVVASIIFPIFGALVYFTVRRDW
jgi:bacteriorhodopsin